MSTNFAYSDGTSAGTRKTAGESVIDPRRRRFGINPYLYLMTMPPRDAGQAQEIIPSGLVTFRTDTLRDENYDDVLRVPEGEFKKEIYREFTAQWFLNNTKIKWTQQGFRELNSIVPLDDPELNKDGSPNMRVFGHSAQGYFAAVHPEIKCDEYGETGCVTCRLRSLGTTEECPPELWNRIKGLPYPDIAEQLRVELIEAYTARHAFCRETWASLLGEKKKREVGEPGIAFIDESGHYLRRHLHEVEPSDAATAASFGQQVGQQTVEGFNKLADAFREAKGGGDLVEVVKLLAEQQASTNKVLEELMRTQKRASKKADAEAVD